uniref:SPNS lysolipid transporter 2, sphingosine-1-phosphate n=1 Tax=Takifugu rubripes TaxID=31033 RepID=A0A674MP58_TAKRU
MCVESDGCEMEGCSSSDEVRTLSGSMSPGLKSNPDLHPCKPGQKFRAALLRCRSPTAAAGILSFGNVLNYMDRYTVAGVVQDIQRHYGVTDSGIGAAANSLHLQLHGGSAHLRLPGRPLQQKGHPELRHLLLVNRHSVQLLHRQRVLLAVCALQRTGGHRRVQLLLHLSHHHRRPLHQ